jgi:hypothetical protein
MNKSASFIFLFLTIAFGAFAIYEYQQAEHLRDLVDQMKKDAAGAREEADTQTAELRKLKEQTRSQKVAITQLEARNKELASAEPATPANAAPGTASDESKDDKGGFLKGFAKMFTDPKMKEAMRAQQAAGINLIYADLARELGLSPDEARQVLALLADRQLDLAGKSMTAMSKGGTDSATLAAAGKENEAAKKSYDEQLKAVLGDEKFAKFQEYEKTIGERYALDQIQKQLTAGGTPLEANQTQGLLAIMREERARTPNAPAPTDTAAQMKMMQSDEGVNSWLKTQEDFNRRVLDRARTVLSPDQILAFEAAQKQQIDLQRMGVQMSREMFKGRK